MNGRLSNLIQDAVTSAFSKSPSEHFVSLFEGLKPTVRHWVLYCKYYIHVLLLCCVAEMWQQQKTTSSHRSGLQCRGLAYLGRIISRLFENFTQLGILSNDR